MNVKVPKGSLCALCLVRLRTSLSSPPPGVVRDKVGDILVQGEAGAQVLVDPELVEHFEMSLTQVWDGVGALAIGTHRWGAGNEEGQV